MSTVKERVPDILSTTSQEEKEYCNYCKMKLDGDTDGFNMSFNEFEEQIMVAEEH